MVQNPAAAQESARAASDRCVAMDGRIKTELGISLINAAKRAVEKMLNEIGEGGNMMYKLS